MIESIMIDFQEQLKQLQNMGPLSNIMKMIPGSNKLKIKDFDEKNIKWVEAIISSMTNKEKLNPSIIDGSRKKRIAKGIAKGFTLGYINIFTRELLRELLRDLLIVYIVYILNNTIGLLLL